MEVLCSCVQGNKLATKIERQIEKPESLILSENRNYNTATSSKIPMLELNLNPVPSLETERFILREITVNDSRKFFYCVLTGLS